MNFICTKISLILTGIIFVSCGANKSAKVSNKAPPKNEPNKTSSPLSQNGIYIEDKEPGFVYRQKIPLQSIPKYQAFQNDFPIKKDGRIELIENNLSCRYNRDCALYSSGCYHNDELEPGRDGFEHYENIPGFFIFNNRLVRNENKWFVYNKDNFKCLDRIRRYCSPEMQPNIKSSSHFSYTARCFDGSCKMDLIRSNWSFLDSRRSSTLDVKINGGSVYSLTDDCELFLVDSLKSN